MADMVNIPSTNEDPNYRYTMPKLTSKIEGRGNGIKTNIVNLKDVANAIKRPPMYVAKWFGTELCTKASYTEKEGEGVKATIMGNHQTHTLQELLDKFLAVYVLCPRCGLPEMDLNCGKGKSQDIGGKCSACGWNGELKEATNHKLASYVLKNPPEGGETVAGAKKLSKAERQAVRAAKASKGGKHEDDSEDDSDDGSKKLKKKSSKSKKKSSKNLDDSDDDDDEDEKKKKKKKSKKDGDKKEKKSKDKKAKKRHSKGSDSDEDENCTKSTKSGSPTEDGDCMTAHKSEDVLELIQNLSKLKESNAAKQFASEAKMQQVSRGLDLKMRMYACWEALFPEGTMDAKSVEKAGEMVIACKEEGDVSLKDSMWGFEMYVNEHNDKALKAFPMVCKALYDLEYFEDGDFVKYWEDNSVNASNPGHSSVHKAIAPFVNWLKEDNDSSSDDSDSD